MEEGTIINGHRRGVTPGHITDCYGEGKSSWEKCAALVALGFGKYPRAQSKSKIQLLLEVPASSHIPHLLPLSSAHSPSCCPLALEGTQTFNSQASELFVPSSCSVFHQQLPYLLFLTLLTSIQIHSP